MSPPNKMKELIIINKAGSLVFSTFNEQSNEILVFASTIESLIDIFRHIFNFEARKQIIEYTSSRIYVFKTLTGYSFVFLWDNADDPPFTSVYRHFCENVLQNYNYHLEMPVSFESFKPSTFF